MLGVHSDIHAPEEPHLITPLAHLGYFATVEKAPYDPIITQGAMRALVAGLPEGEADYLDAMRACSDHLYARLLAPTACHRLLDKTPAYALVLDFLARLYPEARYIVLTRNPMAIWSSFVDSFFDGDHEAAHAHNPVLERYVPAIARFLREPPVGLCHVQYETLVHDPKTELQRICGFAGLPFESGMVNYGDSGENRAAARGLGDPMTVAKEKRPTTASVEKWTAAISGEPDKVSQCERILASLADEDLTTWGYERGQIQAQLDSVPGDGPRKARPSLSRYALERKLLVALRRNIHSNALGRLVRKLRSVCDVLLR